MKTIIEPFKIKTVEPIKFTTKDERLKILKKAHYNLFNVSAENVLIPSNRSHFTKSNKT
jgi:tryptophanase